MSRRKRRFSNVYTPGLSKSFKYMYEDIPDIQTGFDLEDRMDVEWPQGIPWGIIDAWIQNQNYIIWLELFEIVEESNTNILKSLQDRADKHAHPPESTPIEETKLYANNSEDIMLKDVTEETKLSAVALREEF